MPFVFSIAGKNITPLDKYRNYIFLYNCSLANFNVFSKLIFNFKINFENTKYHLLSESAKFILFPKNKLYRPLGTFGIFD
jgi:hypothetical protein